MPRARKHTRRVNRKVPKSVKRYVKRKLDSAVEDKRLASGTVQNINMNATGVNFLFNGIAQGTAIGQRVGNAIKMKHLQVVGQMAVIASPGSASPLQSELFIIYDREPNGAQPDLTGGATSPFLIQMAGRTILNPDKKGRFQVLRTVRRVWENNTDLVGRTSYPLNLSIKLNKKTIYGSNGTSYTDIQKGSLWMIAASNASITFPQAYFNFCLTFEDA